MARRRRQRGEDSFPGLEEEADRIAAERQPDWEELAAVKREARALRAAGKPDRAARNALIDRARDAVPENRPEILRETLDVIDGRAPAE